MPRRCHDLSREVISCDAEVREPLARRPDFGGLRPFRSGFRPKSNKSDSLFVDVCAEYCPSGDATEFLWMELKVEARPDTNQGWSGLLNNDVPKLLQIQVGKTAQKWGDAKEWWHDRSLKGKVGDLKSCASHRFVCVYLQVNREEATVFSKELLDAPIPSMPAHLEAIAAKRIQRLSYPLKVKGCPSVLSMLMWTASIDKLRGA